MKASTILYRIMLAVYRIMPLKKQICLLIKKSGIPFEKIYTDMRFFGPFKVAVEGKKFLLMNYGYTTIENEIFWRGLDNGWERISLSLWKELSKNANVIFDIGANTGVYSLISKVVNPAVNVVAFEPSTRVFEKLMENIHINAFDIVTEQIALSNQNGEVIFYDTFGKHQYSASLSLEMKNNLIDSGEKINEYTVKAQTLTDYIEEHKISRIDLMKIDVELHEYEVLVGLGDYINKFKPTVLIEVLTDEIANKIEPFFTDNGYLFFMIDEINIPKRRRHLTKSGCYNYLLCSEETATYLGL